MKWMKIVQVCVGSLVLAWSTGTLADEHGSTGKTAPASAATSFNAKIIDEGVSQGDVDFIWRTGGILLAVGGTNGGDCLAEFGGGVVAPRGAPRGAERVVVGGARRRAPRARPCRPRRRTGWKSHRGSRPTPDRETPRGSRRPRRTRRRRTRPGRRSRCRRPRWSPRCNRRRSCTVDRGARKTRRR